MSNALAIAAVTSTLRNLIAKGVPEFPNPDQNITTKPLDKVRSGGATPDQLNIFLYQTVLNAAWRNLDMPRQVRPGETGQPPLALNLHYLITAYGENDDDTKSHGWLGRAMSVLHDHPVLGRQEIQDTLAESELQSQVERVRITPQPLALEEMSKLWTAFQTQYRISAAYAVEVVLIESTRPSRTPLPVLTRGEEDRGISAQADLIPPFPTILVLRLPLEQISARPGDEVVITGHDLDGDSVAVRFTSARLATPRSEPATGTADQVKVTVPNDPSNLPPGFYTVAVAVSKTGQPDRFTNEFPLQIAPVISNINPTSAAVGDLTLTLTCTPEIRPEQRAALLFGDREILAEKHEAQTPTLTFKIPDAAKGDYFLRLRVDGVDSLLVVYVGTPPAPQFDPNQKVTIT
jgi:Pvc16 N-terminal domain